MKCAFRTLVIFLTFLAGGVSAQFFMPPVPAIPPSNRAANIMQASDAVPLLQVPFWQSSELGVYSTGMVWRDCNNDGYIDVFFSNGNDMALAPNTIYLSQGGVLPNVASWTSLNAEYSGHCAVGDIDDNGFPDFVVANYLGSGRFETANFSNLYMNMYGIPTTLPGWYNDDSVYSFSCALGDIDSDGDLDLALATGEPYSGIFTPQLVFLNNNGVLQTTPFWQSSAMMGALDVAWGDVDNDGDLDLAFASDDRGATLFYNIGGTLEQMPSWNSANVVPANTLTLGDVNGAGCQDFVVAYPNVLAAGGYFMVYFNNGSGQLSSSPGWSSSSFGYGSAVALNDYDQDGDLDLAAGRWWSSTTVYENVGGNLSVNPVWQSTPQTVIEELSWIDIDGRGTEMFADTLPADGKRLYYLRRSPVQSVDSVSQDGAMLSSPSYCYDMQSAWVSLAAIASTQTIIYYTYSTTNDLTVANWDTVNIAFGNTRAPAVRMYADTTFGWAPLDIQFSDSSAGSSNWLWRFGDGDSSLSQNPPHTYLAGGVYDVYLRTELPGGTHQRKQKNMVIALADSLVGGSVNSSVGAHVELDLYARNILPLRLIRIPVMYDGPLMLTLDSFSTTGCRTEYFAISTYSHYDAWNRRATIRLETSSTPGVIPDLSPGSGMIVRLFFTVGSGAPTNQTNPVHFDGYLSYLPTFISSRATYSPRTLSGEISTASCCLGIRGNVDGSAGDAIDIGDLVFLVEYSFSGGDAPVCEEEADVTGDSSLDIADIVYLVEYSFNSGPTPVACP